MLLFKNTSAIYFGNYLQLSTVLSFFIRYTTIFNHLSTNIPWHLFSSRFSPSPLLVHIFLPFFMNTRLAILRFLYIYILISANFFLCLAHLQCPSVIPRALLCIRYLWLIFHCRKRNVKSLIKVFSDKMWTVNTQGIMLNFPIYWNPWHITDR